MTTLNVYLTFNGDCEQAFTFYKSVFGGDFDRMSRFEEMPENPEYPVSEADKRKIMHVSHRINDQTTLLGSDTGEGYNDSFKQGTNFALSVNAESKEEADEIYKRLSDKGNASMPMSDTFWGSYFGMLTDQFGIQWMVGYDAPRS